MPETVTRKLLAGRYEIRELLGEGGMGLVYRGVDTRTGGLVAIKTIRDVADPRMVEMFKKEWRTLTRLSHPNIVDIRDVDEIEEAGVAKPCYVMPLLVGVTLATLIKESGHRLTVERGVSMLRQVCSGLEAAHKAGLIHRDLKPSNIFIMEDDTAKLIDFGLVYSADTKSVTGYKGTWQYMAPEQTEGKTPTVLSDIFSLGVVAYEALTARKPFARPTVELTVEAIRTLNPPAISEINPKVSQLLSKVIHKAIAKHPLHRYASAREFSETLQKAYQNERIERFEKERILPRIERARSAFEKGDCGFASEILTELEAEGNVDPEITLLRAQIEEAVKQKRIGQLFEGAQTRLEQDEIPLALDKLREILELDAENAEALSMRKRVEDQRNDRQISDWLNLAQQHLKLQDFAEARQALKEVLNIRYGDPDALQLLAEVDLREKEAAKARTEKEQLYGSALRAYQVGEISTALSKLERILEVSRRTPGATIPERDAVYQNFYNRVRSERDTIDRAYEDGRRLLNEKEFQKAVEICNQMLERYPGSAQFHALKLKIEQSERQELSAYIAEVGRSVDAEPSLDRRVNIFEEACLRYPQEVQFQQSLRLMREQRDLVQSISSKAHQYEEQGQFADAIGQWKILRSIHPQYPGVEVEIAQLERRREQQAQEEKRARVVQQIAHTVENGAYAKALALAAEALAEFPQDSELLVLERVARQKLERTAAAERLFEEARKLRGTGRLEEATVELEDALKLDERNAGMRNALASLLFERANLLLEKDWREAEPLAQQALKLDELHPAGKRLRALINEAKRKDYVTHCAAEARELQLSGDVPGAMARLNEGLRQYPDETRLLQYQSSLQVGAAKEAEREAAKSAANSDREAAGAYHEVRPTERPAETGMTALFSRTEVLPHSTLTTVVANQGEVKATERPPIAPEPAGNRTKWIAAGVASAGIVVLAVALWFALHKNPKRPDKTPVANAQTKQIPIPVAFTPADAKLTIDGSAVNGPTLSLEQGRKYDLALTRTGYKPLVKKGMTADASGWKLTLEPEPLRVQVLTSERSGRVLLDGREIWNLEQGDLADFEMAADGGRHTLEAVNQFGGLFRVSFEAQPASSPRVERLTGPALVASGLGDEANVTSVLPGALVSFGDKTPISVSKEGARLDLSGAEPDQTALTIALGDKRQTIPFPHGNAPVLLASLNPNPNLGSATLTTSVEGAKLFFDRKERRARKPGYWHIQANAGNHEIRVVADGYMDTVRTIEIDKGQDLKQTIDLASANAEVAIRGGVAGAELLVDGKLAGKLDSAGALQNSLEPGEHKLQLRKAGFEEVTVTRTFAGGKNTPLDGAMKLLAAINFAATPVFTSIRYRRIGESEWHDGAAGSSAHVTAGKYQVEGSANGYKSVQQEVEVAAGQVIRADLRLQLQSAGSAPPPPQPSSKILHPEELDSKAAPWLTGKIDKFLELRRANRYELTFLDPAVMPGHFNGITKRRPKPQWHVTAGEDEITYELDGQQLTRRVKADGKVTKSTVAAHVADGNSAYTVHVLLDGSGVRITSRDGGTVDAFSSPGFDWSNAMVAIRGNAYFLVR